MSNLTTSTISVAAFLEIAKRQARDLAHDATIEINLAGLREIYKAFDILHYTVCPIVFKAEGEDRAELIAQWKAEEKAFVDAYYAAQHKLLNEWYL